MATSYKNVNIGLLGHVDSGKTSLAKCLSQISSTASFDKSPQSQTRGITLDLGFSSFSIPTSTLQVTIVDCPGHASLFKTIIGGSTIIDLMILVVDVVKGIQPQTAECIVLAEITNIKLIVILNKCDLIDEMKVLEKKIAKLRKSLQNTNFKNSKIIPISTVSQKGMTDLIDEIETELKDVQRNLNGKFVMPVDHCFQIKGRGTVMTGTVLKGKVGVGDVIEIPHLKEERKIKSIQAFKKSVTTVHSGDRVGICVTNLDANAIERSLICSPLALQFRMKVYCKIENVKYFKKEIKFNEKFHISIGHETVIGRVCMFNENGEFKEKLTESSFAVILFERDTLIFEESVLIGSKMDLEWKDSEFVCRIAFFGRILPFPKKLEVFKRKEKTASIDRIIDSQTVIIKGLGKKETPSSLFLEKEIILSHLTQDSSKNEIGIIFSSFGLNGKFKVQFKKPLVFDDFNTEKLTFHYKKFISIN